MINDYLNQSELNSIKSKKEKYKYVRKLLSLEL